MLQSYRELLVWQKAMELALLAYRLTEGFPRRELYGLVAQIRRASVSVPSNIAEGYGRGSRKEYLQFLWIAQGSLKELEPKSSFRNGWRTQLRLRLIGSSVRPKQLARCLAASFAR